MENEAIGLTPRKNTGLMMNKDLGAAARLLRVAALSAFFYKMFLFQPMAAAVSVFSLLASGSSCQRLSTAGLRQ